MKKKALVLGATGLVGKELVEILLNNSGYDKVTLLTRSDILLDHPKLNIVIVDFNNLGKWSEHFKVHDVFCCLGTTIKKARTKEAFRKVDYEYPVQAAKLAKQENARQFIVISSLGANANSPFFYSRVKGELETSLKSISFNGIHIFRPSLLLGNRVEFRLGERIAAKVSEPFSTLFVGGMKKYKPIKSNIVAEAMVKIALLNKEGVHIYSSDDILQIASKEVPM